MYVLTLCALVVLGEHEGEQQRARAHARSRTYTHSTRVCVSDNCDTLPPPAGHTVS